MLKAILWIGLDGNLCLKQLFYEHRSAVPIMEKIMRTTPPAVTLSLQRSVRSAFAFAFVNTGLNAQINVNTGLNAQINVNTGLNAETKPEEVSLQRFVRSAFQISPRGSNLSKESVEVGCS